VTTVEAQRGYDDSILNFHRALIRIRREHPALHAGEIAVADSPAEVLLFYREHGGERIAVCINFGARRRRVSLGEGVFRVLLGTRREKDSDLGSGLILLAPHEVIVALQTH
jgi:glycosidase